MLRKLLVLTLLVFSVLTLSVACDGSKNGSTVGFTLSELPDIGKFNPKSSPTFFGEALTSFVPNDGYGLLVPYFGGKFDYKLVGEKSEGNVSETPFFTAPLFGLCTADGKIVTAPIFEGIEFCDGFYLCEIFNRNAAWEKRYSSDSSYTPCGQALIIPSDGSSVAELEIVRRNIYYCGDGIFAYTPKTENGVNSAEEVFCNAKGETLHSERVGLQTVKFFGGIALLFGFGKNERGEEITVPRFVDTSFETVSVPVEADTLDCGFFSVGDGRGNFGVTDGKNMLLPLEYDAVFGDENGVVALKGTNAYAFDSEMKPLGTFAVGGDGLKNNVIDAAVIGPDTIFVETVYTGSFLLSLSGKKVGRDVEGSVFFPEYEIYAVSFNKYAAVFDSGLNEIYRVGSGYYCHGRTPRFDVPVFFNSDLTEAVVYNPSDGKAKTFSLYMPYYAFGKNLTLATGSPEKRNLALTDPVTGETKTRFDGFVRVFGSAVGTLVGYNLDGLAVTADENFKVLCRTPLNETD